MKIFFYKNRQQNKITGNNKKREPHSKVLNVIISRKERLINEENNKVQIQFF